MATTVSGSMENPVQPDKWSNKRKAAVAVTAIAIPLLLAFGLCILLKAGPISKVPGGVGIGMVVLSGLVAVTWGCYEEQMDPNP
ncbi:MAG: hypothetical protein H7A36_00815 [Chlamydiales bacterium]|nr:hypothetical protein [Chlamydiales bacterium]